MVLIVLGGFTQAAQTPQLIAQATGSQHKIQSSSGCLLDIALKLYQLRVQRGNILWHLTPDSVDSSFLNTFILKYTILSRKHHEEFCK